MFKDGIKYKSKEKQKANFSHKYEKKVFCNHFYHFSTALNNMRHCWHNLIWRVEKKA